MLNLVRWAAALGGLSLLLSPLPARAASVTAVVDPRGVGGSCADGRGADVVSAERPLCTLGAALALTRSGGTILLRAGVHTPGTVSRPVAETAGWVTMRPWPGEAADVTVDGLRLERAARVRVEGLRLTSLHARDSQQIEVAANDVTPGPLYLRGITGARVVCNTVHDGGYEGRGLLLQGASGQRNRDVVVAHNRFRGLTGDAIAVFNGADAVTISGNEIFDVGKATGSSEHVDAIQLMGGTGYDVSGNYIHDVLHGILFKDGQSTAVQVRDNVITGVGAAPLQLYDTPSALMSGNLIWDNRYGVILDRGAEQSGGGFRLIGNALESLSVPLELVAEQRDNVIAWGPRGSSDVAGPAPTIVAPAAGPENGTGCQASQPDAGEPPAPPGAPTAVPPISVVAPPASLPDTPNGTTTVAAPEVDAASAEANARVDVARILDGARRARDLALGDAIAFLPRLRSGMLAVRRPATPVLAVACPVAACHVMATPSLRLDDRRPAPATTVRLPRLRLGLGAGQAGLLKLRLDRRQLASLRRARTAGLRLRITASASGRRMHDTLALRVRTLRR